MYEGEKGGLVFVACDRFGGTDLLVKEFEKGLVITPGKIETRILCACSGKSFEIGKQIGASIHAPICFSSFLSEDKNPKTMTLFLENCAKTCHKNELVFVSLLLRQMRYVRKHIQETMAGYYVGRSYGIR